MTTEPKNNPPQPSSQGDKVDAALDSRDSRRLNVKRPESLESIKRKVVDYFADPDQAITSRSAYIVDYLGYSDRSCLYQRVSPQELSAWEAEGFERRKKALTAAKSRVYDALKAKAESGDVMAAKEWLNRVEGKALGSMVISNQHTFTGFNVNFVTGGQPDQAALPGQDLSQHNLPGGAYQARLDQQDDPADPGEQNQQVIDMLQGQPDIDGMEYAACMDDDRDELDRYDDEDDDD